MRGMFAQAKSMYGESSDQGGEIFNLEQLWFCLQSDHVEGAPDIHQEYSLTDILTELQRSGITYTLQSAQAKLQAAVNTVAGLKNARRNNASTLRSNVLEAVVIFQVCPHQTVSRFKI